MLNESGGTTARERFIMYKVVTYSPHVILEIDTLRDAKAECRRLYGEGLTPKLYAPGGTRLNWREVG